MRYLFCLFILFYPVLACSQDDNPRSTNNEVLHVFPATLDDRVTVFTHVNLVPMDGEGIRRDMTVVISDDRIHQVGTADEIEMPPGSRIIEARGKYLLPGLAEMHGHIPPVNNSDLPDRYLEDVLFLYIAGGVTTVRGMLGRPGQLLLKDEVRYGEIISPSLYLAGPSFSGGSIDSPEQAAERVREQVSEGWDLLKVHPGLTMEEYEAMARTANELGIPFAGHVPEEVGLERALTLGQKTVDHLDGYIDYMNASERPVTEQELQQAAELTLGNDAWVVPTQALWETLIGAADADELLSFDELKYMPPEIVNSWTNFLQNNLTQTSIYSGEYAEIHAENRQRLLKALQDGGVKILMGTDAPQYFSVPGLTLIRELELMEEAGLTRYQILMSGTSNVGRYFSDKDQFGTIAEGQRADLILLPGNPLEDLSVLSDHDGVMVRGRWITRETIDGKLEEIENAYRR